MRTSLIPRGSWTTLLPGFEPSDREEFEDFKQYLTDIRKMLIVDIRQGSLIITVPGAVRYRSLMNYGKIIVVVTHVNEMAQKCLVTNEILTEFGLKEAKPTTTILEKEYRTCREHFLDLIG